MLLSRTKGVGCAAPENTQVSFLRKSCPPVREGGCAYLKKAAGTSPAQCQFLVTQTPLGGEMESSDTASQEESSWALGRGSASGKGGRGWVAGKRTFTMGGARSSPLLERKTSSSVAPCSSPSSTLNAIGTLRRGQGLDAEWEEASEQTNTSISPRTRKADIRSKRRSTGSDQSAFRINSTSSPTQSRYTPPITSVEKE